MSRFSLALTTITTVAALLGAALPLQAADSSEPAPAREADPLAPARVNIKAKRWPAALADLKRVNASNSADWNNLMGYTLRKQSPPDLDGAQRHYDAALRIDPGHRGALEYAGELALMKGELPVAEQRLAALTRACNGPCEELDDLKKAVEKYKANGNRYQP